MKNVVLPFYFLALYCTSKIPFANLHMEWPKSYVALTIIKVLSCFVKYLEESPRIAHLFIAQMEQRKTEGEMRKNRGGGRGGEKIQYSIAAIPPPPNPTLTAGMEANIWNIEHEM